MYGILSSYRDNLQEMLKPVLWKNKKNVYLNNWSHSQKLVIDIQIGTQIIVKSFFIDFQ